MDLESQQSQQFYNGSDEISSGIHQLNLFTSDSQTYNMDQCYRVGYESQHQPNSSQENPMIEENLEELQDQSGIVRRASQVEEDQNLHKQTTIEKNNECDNEQDNEDIYKVLCLEHESQEQLNINQQNYQPKTETNPTIEIISLTQQEREQISGKDPISNTIITEGPTRGDQQMREEEENQNSRPTQNKIEQQPSESNLFLQIIMGHICIIFRANSTKCSKKTKDSVPTNAKQVSKKNPSICQQICQLIKENAHLGGYLIDLISRTDNRSDYIQQLLQNQAEKLYQYQQYVVIEKYFNLWIEIENQQKQKPKPQPKNETQNKDQNENESEKQKFQSQCSQQSVISNFIKRIRNVICEKQNFTSEWALSTVYQFFEMVNKFMKQKSFTSECSKGIAQFFINKLYHLLADIYLINFNFKKSQNSQKSYSAKSNIIKSLLRHFQQKKVQFKELIGVIRDIESLYQKQKEKKKKEEEREKENLEIKKIKEGMKKKKQGREKIKQEIKKIREEMKKRKQEMKKKKQEGKKQKQQENNASEKDNTKQKYNLINLRKLLRSIPKQKIDYILNEVNIYKKVMESKDLSSPKKFFLKRYYLCVIPRLRKIYQSQNQNDDFWEYKPMSQKSIGLLKRQGIKKQKIQQIKRQRILQIKQRGLNTSFVLERKWKDQIQRKAQSLQPIVQQITTENLQMAQIQEMNEQHPNRMQLMLMQIE